MKFINEPKDKPPYFKDVKDSQFFICTKGYLWAKYRIHTAFRIALCDGSLSVEYSEFSPSARIKEIKSEITGIEF